MKQSSSESSRRVVAGHQPNFFPWFGYFEKMIKSDIFVFSDDVQFPKRCYVNRVEIPIRGMPAYLTLPVVKGSGEKIYEKKYLKDGATLKKILKTIEINLGMYPYASDLQPILEEFSTAYYRYDCLGELNINMNQYLARAFRIQSNFREGTELGLDTFKKNERLIQRCKILGASTYLCGVGAKAYQDDNLLLNEGIRLNRLDYSLTKKLMGDDIRYSVLLGIAKRGMKSIVTEIGMISKGDG